MKNFKKLSLILFVFVAFSCTPEDDNDYQLPDNRVLPGNAKEIKPTIKNNYKIINPLFFILKSL